MKDKLAAHILLCCVLGLMTLLAMPAGVQASNWDFEETNYYLAVGDHYAIWDNFSQNDEFNGYMETASETETVDFFICNHYNYDEWLAGRSAVVYQQALDVNGTQFSFTVPTADAWYAVFSNVGGSSGVTIDVAADKNADHSPRYDAGMYNTVVYGEVLLPDWHYYVYDIYDVGTTLYGHVSTWFSTDGVDVFFCDETNYELWYNTGSATRYSLVTNMHTTAIGDFVVPYDGTWYLVIVAQDEPDTLTISFGYDYALPTTTTGTTTTSGGTGPLSMQTLLIVGVVAVVGIVGLAAVQMMRSHKHDQGPQGAVPTAAKVLVVCPYCGGKNEQGMTKCAHCGAEI